MFNLNVHENDLDDYLNGPHVFFCEREDISELLKKYVRIMKNKNNNRDKGKRGYMGS